MEELSLKDKIELYGICKELCGEYAIMTDGIKNTNDPMFMRNLNKRNKLHEMKLSLREDIENELLKILG